MVAAFHFRQEPKTNRTHFEEGDPVPHGSFSAGLEAAVDSRLFGSLVKSQVSRRSAAETFTAV